MINKLLELHDRYEPAIGLSLLVLSILSLFGIPTKSTVYVGSLAVFVLLDLVLHAMSCAVNKE